MLLGRCRCPSSLYSIRTHHLPDRVLNPLGHGSFGTVVKAEDTYTSSVVAIKLLHRDELLHNDVNTERKIYRKLVEGCDPRVEYFAHVHGTGVHDGFSCTVFELCYSTLYNVVKGYSGLVPLPSRHVMEIAYQLISAVAYLHSLGIAHTDIKLDNIALKYGDTVNVQWLDPTTGFQEKKLLVSTHICVLDLGNAVEVSVNTGNYGRIGARSYRAPEVTLGLPWSFGVDSFGVGCVIAEVYLQHNVISMDIETDREQLATIDALVGPFPEAYARLIEEKVPGTFVFGDVVSVKYPGEGKNPTDRIHTSALRRLSQVRPLSAYIHNPLLHDLVHKLMCPDPRARMNMEHGLRHRYFDGLRSMQLQ
ncbi:kinase-like protein [Trametes cingulata]|nr:kinase-like protein [Trametes cingulata]